LRTATCSSKHSRCGTLDWPITGVLDTTVPISVAFAALHSAAKAATMGTNWITRLDFMTDSTRSEKQNAHAESIARHPGGQRVQRVKLFW